MNPPTTTPIAYINVTDVDGVVQMRIAINREEVEAEIAKDPGVAFGRVTRYAAGEITWAIKRIFDKLDPPGVPDDPVQAAEDSQFREDAGFENACALCGEPLEPVDGTEPDLGEMHGSPVPKYGNERYGMVTRGIVHASCGEEKGWEVS